MAADATKALKTSLSVELTLKKDFSQVGGFRAGLYNIVYHLSI